MGRFASTVALYEELRPPYPEEFFRTVALRLKLSKQHALIDLGTGPGLLALGFAPHVGRIVGVDPEPDMLAAAKQAAARACRDFALIEARAETLAETIGMFDLVTIGRALHWMDRGATLSTLERLVAPDGRILVCASFSAHDARNPWLEDYNAVRRAWSPAALWEESGSGARTHRDLAGFFAGSAFLLAELIKVETSHTVSVRDLARRVLTFSSSSPEALGDNVDAMLRDVVDRLGAHSHDGEITEAVISIAQVVRRSA
jgi:SAM-dependent methyltransferase